MSYYPTVSEIIIQYVKPVLRSEYGIDNYFDGDPIDIPRGYLPCFIVEKLEGDADQLSTQRDDLNSRYMIKVVMNKEDDFGASDEVDTTQKKLERIVEGRDSTTAQYLSNSVLGILRQNYTLGNRITHQTAKVRYGVNNSRPDAFTSEAQIELTVQEKIQLSAPRT
jgi:hypothetical protein